MGLLLNRAKANTATTGTGTVTLGGAVVPYQTFAAAGAVNAQYYDYLIEDGNAWELGTGLYNATAGTLTRPGPTTDRNFASSSGALLNLSGSATIACVAGAQGAETQFIGEIVAAGGETTLSIANIPPGLRDLFITFSFNLTTNTSTNTMMRFNDDASAVYNVYRHYGGSSTSGDQFTNQTGVTNLCAAQATANLFSSGELSVQRYTATDRFKNFIAKVHQANSGHVIDIGGNWRSLAAVNKVSLIMPTLAFAAGSVLTVYGRA